MKGVTTIPKEKEVNKVTQVTIRTTGQQQVALAQVEQEIGFTLPIVGRSQAPIFPQQVGKWWMEPVTSQTVLPPRARQRLQAVLRSGIRIKAIVLFHEIPSAPPRATAWQRMRDAAPAVGKHLLIAVGALLTGMVALLAVAAVAALLLAIGSALLVLGALALIGQSGVDPCLVVVTEEGDWLEVDRWYL